MNPISLNDVANEQLAAARDAHSGRAAHTVHGGHENSLRQTVIALAAGRELAEHESPGEATLQVLAGRVVLRADEDAAELSAGQQVAIPLKRHSLEAIEDSAVLLTVLAGR